MPLKGLTEMNAKWLDLKKWKSCLGILTPLLLCSQKVLIANEEECSCQVEEWQTQEPVSASPLEGIFITGEAEDVIPEGRPEISGIQFMDINIPGESEELANRLKPFLGRPVTEETAIAIKQQIIGYYINKGVTMVGVELPNQMSEGGVLQFLVLRKRMGQIHVKGESFYDSTRLGHYLGITPDQEIADDVLQNNLSWLNKNPFHNSQLKFVPTDDPYVLDIEVTSKRRRALRFYVKGDNTGSANTGYGRLYTGFAWGNAFWIGDILSFEYETSNEFKRLQSWTVNYTSFLPNKNILVLYGEYVVVKPRPPVPLPTFLRSQNTTAKIWQVKPRYTIPFRPLYTPLQQSLSFGFDVKNTNSSIVNLTGGSPSVQAPSSFRSRSEIYVTQLAGSYTLYDKVGRNNYSFNASFYLSPFKFLPHQTNSDYEKLRFHSHPKYCYLKVTAGDEYEFCNEWSLALLVRGQVSNDTLPPTELFNIGGYDTVRGYHQAEASGDNGLIVNFEMRTPRYSIFPCCKGKLSFLAFLDYGLSNNWHIRPPKIARVKTLPNTQYLLGIGPGLRYTINPYFQLRCDYGFKLHHLASNTPFLRKLHSGFGQLHIGALASF